MNHRILPTILIALVLTIALSAAPTASAVGEPVVFGVNVIDDDLPNVSATLAVDIDENGTMDLLAGDRDRQIFYLYLNDGHEHFTPRIIDPQNVIYYIAAGDIDDDGDTDIAVTGDVSGYELFWYENDGSENFTPIQVYPMGSDGGYTAIRDVDEDGDQDLVTTHAGFNVAHALWFENDGEENFTPHEILTLATPDNGGCSMDAGDFNGIPGVDFLVACDGSAVFMLDNDGAENFTRRDLSQTWDDSMSIQSIDFDKDGDLDVVLSKWFEGAFWLENTGAEEFTPHQISSGRSWVATVSAADFNDDGYMDVVESLREDNQVALWINQGDNLTFVEQTIDDTLNGPMLLDVEDVDNDGTQDVVLAENLGGRLIWYEQDPEAELEILRAEFINMIFGSGPGSVEDDFHSIIVVARVTGPFPTPALADIRLTVDDAPIPATKVSAVAVEGDTRIQMNFRLPDAHKPGHYALSIAEGEGRTLGPRDVGYLRAQLSGAPDLITPSPDVLLGGLLEATPTELAWTEFAPEYPTPYLSDPRYNVMLTFPNEDVYEWWSDAPTNTSMPYINGDWEPMQPPDWDPGAYTIDVMTSTQVDTNLYILNDRVYDIRFRSPADLVNMRAEFVNTVYGSGPGSPETDSYDIWVLTALTGSFPLPDLTDIQLTVNDNDIIEASSVRTMPLPDLGRTRVIAHFELDGPPTIGSYQYSLIDDQGRTLGPWPVGDLLDIPRGAPDWISPSPAELISGLHATPTEFEWSSYTQDYPGGILNDEGYGVGLSFPGGQGIDYEALNEPGVMSMPYVRDGWNPEQPPPWDPGIYGVHVEHSIQVSERISLLNHRSYQTTLTAPPAITNAHLMIWTDVEGDADQLHYLVWPYNFTTTVDATGDLAGIQTSDVEFSVNHETLDLTSVQIVSVSPEGVYRLRVKGKYAQGQLPRLGTYRITVKDAYGRPSNEWEIGTLLDHPEEGPIITDPQYLAVTSETQPSVTWGPFIEDYNGGSYVPQCYGVMLAEDPPYEASLIPPIPGDQGGTFEYVNENWDPEQPGPLTPGVHIWVVSCSLNGVIPGINFDYNRSANFIVVEPADTDMDGVPDLEDICPNDPDQGCDPFGSAAGLVGPLGGNLSTQDGRVEIQIPPGAITPSGLKAITLSITDLGSGFELTTNQGEIQAVVAADIQPEGTVFESPITITFKWSDSDSDGVVDGTSINESDLVISKDQQVVAGPCNSDPNCDTVGNSYSVQTTSLSAWVLGGPANPEILHTYAEFIKVDGVNADGTLQASSYVLWVKVTMAGSFPDPNTEDIVFIVPGVDGTVEERPATRIPRIGMTGDGNAFFNATLHLGPDPFLDGSYSIRVRNRNTNVWSGPWQLSTLVGPYPSEVPVVVSPFPSDLATGITDSRPTFRWRPFTLHYASTDYPADRYAVRLYFPNGDSYEAFVSGDPGGVNESGLYELSYVNSDWFWPTEQQPPPLEPGVYTLDLEGSAQISGDAQHTVDITHVQSYDFNVLEGITTPTGQNVAVDLDAGISIVFAQVAAEGTTIIETPDPVAAPSGFQILGDLYDIVTTADFSSATVCFTYDDTGLAPAQEGAVQLLHQENGEWADVTDDGYPDTSLNQVCGTVTSFSPFMVALSDVVVSTPVDPQRIGTSVEARAVFGGLGDGPYTAVWYWGDEPNGGSGQTVTVNGSAVDATHVYNTPGVYTITVTITDASGASATGTSPYVVVYDPNGGFVTGGGWFNSPEAAYAADASRTGKATFGFVSKYQKGANVPTGNTEFQFRVADLKFSSTSYDWLVVAGARAQFKGSGTINGAGEYGFMLTAVDGQVNGGMEVDKFRIKIWDKGTGEVIYDNQMGATNDSLPTTALQGGSIVIHK